VDVPTHATGRPRPARRAHLLGRTHHALTHAHGLCQLQPWFVLHCPGVIMSNESWPARAKACPLHFWNLVFQNDPHRLIQSKKFDLFWKLHFPKNAFHQTRPNPGAPLISHRPSPATKNTPSRKCLRSNRSSGLRYGPPRWVHPISLPAHPPTARPEHGWPTG